MDFRLLEAYQVMKDENCRHCGHPVWLCRNENVMWAVETDLCNADQVLQKWQESKVDSKGKSTIKPGVHPFVKPFVLVPGNDGDLNEDFVNLPSRKEFFEQPTV